MSKTKKQKDNVIIKAGIFIALIFVFAFTVISGFWGFLLGVIVGFFLLLGLILYSLINVDDIDYHAEQRKQYKKYYRSLKNDKNK